MNDWFPANSDGQPGFEFEPPEEKQSFEEWANEWAMDEREAG